MGWIEDLQSLLEETGEDFAGSAVGQPVIGALTSRPAQVAFDVLDAPLSGVKYGVGLGIGALNQAGMLLPGGMSPEDLEIARALEAGGGRGVWENRIAQAPLPVQAALEIGLDPLTYTGAGLVGRGARLAREASNLSRLRGRPVQAAALDIAATMGTGAQRLNDLPGQLVLPPVQAGVRQVRRGIERIAPTAFETAPEYRIRQSVDAFRNATVAERSAARRPVPEMPSVRPLAESAAPPLMPHPHPRGSAPASIYAQMADAWRRLRDPRLGIVPLADEPGRAVWRRPEDVRLTEAHIADMARVGLGAMQTVSDTGGLFPSLVRASEGTAKLREAIIAEFGPGIEPYIPAVYQRIRADLAAEGKDPDAWMPASRFLLPWGWSGETVGTKRLQRLGKGVGDDPAKREAALEKARRYPKGSPEVVEAAAAMGAGFLSLFRQGADDTYRKFTPGGVYFPEVGGGRTNARAIVPAGFASEVWEGGGDLAFDLSEAGQVIGVSQPFGSNREAWDAYMRSTFGDLADDELETLADMSVEMLYDEYVNAANEFSGGAQGATRIGKALAPEGDALDPAAFLTAKGRLPDTAKKIAGQRGGPKGGITPNLAQLVAAWDAGKGMAAGTGVARDYYERGARELLRVVGAGEYEDARFLLHALAATSAATDVERNAELALRVMAEWKFGRDDALRQIAGIGGPEFDQIMAGGLLRADMAQSQRATLQRLFNDFIQRRDDPAKALEPIRGIHGGPKTHNYAGSYLANLWRRGIDRALGEAKQSGPMKAARKAFDDALAVYTLDRHINRIDFGATGVNPIEAFLNRERGILAARAADLSGEEAQAAGWYWVRDRQGLVREVGVNSDTAAALRAVVQKTWDQSPDAGESWDALVARVAQETGKAGEEAIDEAYDLVRQHVFYRLLKSSFDKPEVQQALRAAGMPTSLAEWQGDVLGFMARGAAGLMPEEWAQPLGAVESEQLRQQMEASLGTEAAFRFDPDARAWAPAATGESIPVPLLQSERALDPGQAKTAAKAIERFIARPDIARLFDPVEHYGLADVLGFGVADGKPQLVAFARDEADVRLLREKLRDVPRTSARDLPRLLEEVFGPPEARPRFTREQVRRRGITLAELDVVNPVSLFQRRVVAPVMDAYAELSLREGMNEATGQSIDDLSLPEWPDVAASKQMGYNPGISLNDNETLAQKLPDGRTWRRFRDETVVKVAKDRQALIDAGAAWGPYSTVQERLDAVKALPNRDALQKLVRAWGDEGIDLLYVADPDDVAASLLGRELAKEAGVRYDRSTVPALLRAAWGEQALLSPKYHTGNILGSWIQNALGGTFGSLNPRDFAAAYKVARAGTDATTRAEALGSLKATQIANKWGLEKPPVEIMRGGVRALTGERTSGSAIGELTSRLTRNERLGRRVGYLFQANADFGLAVDGVARGAVWEDVFDREMLLAMPAWEAEVRRRAAGVPGFEFSVLEQINVPEGGMFFAPLKARLIELGLQDGVAERLARDFNEIRHKANAAARSELNRRQFSYDRANLDEWIGRFVPFHYWFSRALRYYGEEAVRHPFLALNYMRANDGIEDAQNDPGLSARQKGFLRLFGTPLGFSLLMNPDALFGVVKVFGMTDAYEPDGQTSLGGAVNWLKNRGFGLYPWIDGTLNLMGMYGNTFEPDLLGIRHKALVGSAINAARAHFGFDPASAPYADAMGQLRHSVSTFVSSFTPDWLSQPVAPRAGGSSQEATLDTLIENIIIQEQPALSNQELLDIMTDPDHPTYQQAYLAVANAGIAQQLLNFVAPTSFRYRLDSRDVRAAQLDLIREGAQAAGVSPYEFAPRPGDLEFAARYKAQTGADWKPEDTYADLKARHDLARAPQEAKQFIVDEAAYHTLGSPRQQAAFDAYQGLLTGSDPKTEGLPYEARLEIARQWADRNNAGKAIDRVYALREDWKATHPEFAEFQAWQDAMYALAEQFGGSLAEYRRQASQQNPNAARYFADQLAWIQQTFPQEEWEAQLERATTSAAAWHAITGKATLRSVQGPIPGVPPVDVTLPGMMATQAAQPSYGEDWARSLASLGRGYGIESARNL